MGKIMEIPGARGSNTKPSGTENPVGWGGQARKNPLWGGYGYFLEAHITTTDSAGLSHCRPPQHFETLMPTVLLSPLAMLLNQLTDLMRVSASFRPMSFFCCSGGTISLHFPLDDWDSGLELPYEKVQ